MAGGLNDIIARLEEQKSVVERALSALREIEGTGVQSGEEKPPAPRKVRVKRKRGITPEGRKRLAEAMKRRWAVKRDRSTGQEAGQEGGLILAQSGIRRTAPPHQLSNRVRVLRTYSVSLAPILP